MWPELSFSRADGTRATARKIPECDRGKGLSAENGMGRLGWGERGGGTNWEIGIDVYTLLTLRIQ